MDQIFKKYINITIFMRTRMNIFFHHVMIVMLWFIQLLFQGNVERDFWTLRRNYVTVFVFVLSLYMPYIKYAQYIDTLYSLPLPVTLLFIHYCLSFIHANVIYKPSSPLYGPLPI